MIYGSNQVGPSGKHLQGYYPSHLLEAVHGELEFVFEQNPDWNPDIKWQIEEAACKLGFTLATLSNWYDDEEE